ncbi:hypothetical protein BN1232_06403 [Mycobacterium lentiflavum]|uniref:Transmembrane protein n=1 Tax=Mycobacterium lentiflavum TaxID=141349 RepID=A0A0E4CRP2_MYCLN|nr:hypothetical protein BN1232_06403 [Mycobacterium lentiflavum]
MTTWYGGWGWCSPMINTPVMLLLFGAVFTAIILAVRSAGRRSSDPAAAAPYGRAQHEVAAPPPRSKPENDDFYRRLM